MLLDQWRMEAFQQAISQVVTPRSTVLELGGGTGVLSFFAAQCGAKVICVERNPELVKSARAFLQLNHVAENVEVIQADAMQYLPDSPIDVVICEMLHVAMIREKQLGVLNHFRSRYEQKYPGKLPRFIPEASLLAVQAIQYDYHFCGYQAPVPLFHNPALKEERTRCITDAAVYSTICYDEQIPLQFNWQETLRVVHSGNINAIRFITKNMLTIEIESKQSVDWSNQFLILPIKNPQQVTAGDTVSLAFSYPQGCTLDELSTSLNMTIEAGQKNLKKAV